jgi:hypothetical protein
MISHVEHMDLYEAVLQGILHGGHFFLGERCTSDTDFAYLVIGYERHIGKEYQRRNIGLLWDLSGFRLGWDRLATILCWHLGVLSIFQGYF